MKKDQFILPSETSKHDSTYNSRELQIQKDMDNFLEVKKQLIDFGLDPLEAENYLSRNFSKIRPGNFREKCLIAENFKHFDYFLDHPFLFGIQYQRLFALEKFYHTLPEETRQTKSFVTFTSHPEKSKYLYGCTQEQMMERYPLTKERLQLMERIHHAKKGEKNKSK